MDNPENNLPKEKPKITVTPLKLILMSATIDEQLLNNEKLFKKRPAAIGLQKKLFPVAVHFQPTQPDDLLQLAFEKVVEVHQKFGAGNILVFLNG